MLYLSHLKHKPESLCGADMNHCQGNINNTSQKKKKKSNAIYPLCIFTANTIVDIVNCLLTS